LGLKLVDRRPRSYVLTVDGERIAALATRMEEASFAVGRAVRAVQPAFAGEVSISAPPLLASTLIAPRLAELRNAHPDLHVRLIGEKRSASLSRREADLAIRLSKADRETAGVPQDRHDRIRALRHARLSCGV
jgi:DNA-binding transcriptional LysR family regulator